MTFWNMIENTEAVKKTLISRIFAKKKCYKQKLKRKNWLGVVAHTCNFSTLGGQGRNIAWSPKFETSLDNKARLCLYKKF